MSLVSQSELLVMKVEVPVALAAKRAKLKQGKFEQLSNSATKAGAGECAGGKIGMKKRERPLPVLRLKPGKLLIAIRTMSQSGMLCCAGGNGI